MGEIACGHPRDMPATVERAVTGPAPPRLLIIDEAHMHAEEEVVKAQEKLKHLPIKQTQILASIV